MPAIDHPNNEPNGHPNGKSPGHDRPKENDPEGNDGRRERSAAGPERDGDPANEPYAVVHDDGHHDAHDDPRPLTRRDEIANLRFNRTLSSVLDLLERAGFAFFVAAWTLLAVYDQLDAPLTIRTVLAVSGPVVMVIAVVLRVWLAWRFERPEE